MPFITPLQNTEIARVVGEFIDTVWYEISAVGPGSWKADQL